MKIFVKTLSGGDCAFKVVPDTKVSALKILVSQNLGIAVDNQIIIFAGKQLTDGDLTLEACGITKGCTVHVLQKDSPIFTKPVESSTPVVTPSAPPSTLYPTVPSGPSYLVKINFEDDIRRFEFQGCNAKILLDKIAEVYGLKNMAKFVLKYKDNEGDLVTISTDSELEYAVKHQLSSENLLRLDMTLKVKKEKVVAKEKEEEPQKVPCDPKNFREIWKERKMKWREEKEKWQQQKKQLCREMKLMRKNSCHMKLCIPETGLKEGAVIMLCSYPDKKNEEGGMGWFLGVTDQGALVPNGAPNVKAHWIVEEVKGGAICLASAVNAVWHLRILDDGTVNAKGARGKYAQFIPEIQGDKICLRCVAHEGKKNKGGSCNWYVGVTPDGYIIGEADNNNFSKFTVSYVQQSDSGNISA